MIAFISMDSEPKFLKRPQKPRVPLRNIVVLGLNSGNIHCRLAPSFVAKANRNRPAVTAGRDDSRGGPMKDGIKLLADDTYGRVEISNRKEFKHFSLRPSKKAVKEIEQLEELTLAAEQRLGNFVVGSNRG